MAALDREHQIARGGDIGGGDMHVDAEPRAEHAARIADAVDAVDRIADRQRMQHGAAVAQRMAAAGGQYAGDIAFGNGGADDFDLGGEQFAGQPPGRDRQHHRLDFDGRHALGAIDGLADGFLGFGEIDDAAGLHAARGGMAEADRPRWHGCGGSEPAAARCGRSRAIRQTTLLEPTSSAATSALRRGEIGFIFGVRP